MTVLDLITESLQDLNIIQPGETPDSASAATAFTSLNDWLDSLKTEALSVYSQVRTTWTISSASSYTVGIGATVNVARPTSPNALYGQGFQDTSYTPTTEYAVSLLTQDQYESIPQKTQTATYLTSWFYNPTYTSSSAFGALIPWPIPTSSTLQGVLYTGAPVDEFAAQSTVIALPPGYRRFLRANLARELARPFQQAVSPELFQAAESSKAAIKRANYRQTELTLGTAGAMFAPRRVSNIYTGT